MQTSTQAEVLCVKYMKQSFSEVFLKNCYKIVQYEVFYLERKKTVICVINDFDLEQHFFKNLWFFKHKDIKCAF